MIAEVDRVDAVGGAERRHQRRQDDDRRVDLEDAPEDQQDDVERQQEDERRLDVRLHPLEERVGNHGVDQVAGQAERRGEKDQDRAGEDSGS